MREKRRRIDLVLATGFVADLESSEEEELLERHRLADAVENELSLYRTMLHGRIDLLEYEQRRRSGEEDRSLMEALPELLSDTRIGDANRYSDTLIYIAERTGRREIDKVLDGDPVLVLDTLDDDQLSEAVERLRTEEQNLSTTRQRVHEVIDKLNRALAQKRELVAE